MKSHILTVLLLVSLAVCGCDDSKRNDPIALPENSSQNGSESDGKNDEANLAPNEGESCDFREFTPFCSSDHKAVNCSTFDGFSVEKCKEDEECVIGITEGFFSKKPDAGCYRPCTENDIGKEISICEDDTNTYYKCEKFNEKYYYSDYSSYVDCDRGCNSEGTDCVKISEKEYEVCDENDSSKKYICDNNISLVCNYCRGLGCDAVIYGAFDCESEGKTCAHGKCVEKHVSDEYEDCKDDYKSHCENGYMVMCGWEDYVTAYECDEGTTCVEIEGELNCLEPCSEADLGKSADICQYEYYENGTTYRQCEKVGDGYYYVEKGGDSCNGECNDDHTACLSIHCSPFYDARCSDEHTIKYCKDEAINFESCDPDRYCVDTGGYYPNCLEKCSAETEQPVIRCECDEENDCWTYKYNCTQYDDSYYLKFDSLDKHCDGLCNTDGTSCAE